MLRMIVELHPGGISEFRRTLATMTVANRSDLADVSDYQVVATEGANPLTGAPARKCVFKIIAHERRQSVWKLIGAALREMEKAECAGL
jgi:hypothetical protein